MLQTPPPTKQPDSDSCAHERHGFFRLPFRRKDGSTGEHIVCRCLDCGANKAGVGRWIPRRAVKNAEKLPLDPFAGAGARQPGLFDRLGS